MKRKRAELVSCPFSELKFEHTRDAIVCETQWQKLVGAATFMHSMQQVEGKSGSVQPHKDLVKINEVKKGNNVARVIFARAKKFDSKFRLVEPAGSVTCFCGQCVMDWAGLKKTTCPTCRQELRAKKWSAYQNNLRQLVKTVRVYLPAVC